MVYFDIGTWLHEVSKQNWLEGNDLLKSGAKLLHLLHHQLVKPGPVLLTDQAITEDPAALVVPQSQQVLFVLAGNPSKTAAMREAKKCYERCYQKSWFLPSMWPAPLLLQANWSGERTGRRKLLSLLLSKTTLAKTAALQRAHYSISLSLSICPYVRLSLRDLNCTFLVLIFPQFDFIFTVFLSVF